MTMKEVQKQSAKWFRARRYGWGWTPNTWEGWLFTLVWLILFLGLTVTPQLLWPDDAFVVVWAGISGLFLTGLLLVITYRTGEPPAWHWGGKTNKK